MLRKSILYIKLAVLILIPFFSCAQPEKNDSIEIDSLDIYYDEDDTYYEEEYVEEYYETERSFMQMGDISFSAGVPLMRSKRKFNHNPIGVDLSYSRQINEKTPLYGLIGLNYSFYGSESFNYYNSTTIEGYGDEWEESFLTHFLTVYAGGRYFSKRSFLIFNPYCQLDLRFRYLFGIVTTENIEYGEVVDSESKGGNGSLGYGITIGSLIDIKTDNVFLNFSVTYDGGGGMKYFNRIKDPGEIFFVTDYFEQTYFPNSLLTFKIGLIF